MLERKKANEYDMKKAIELGEHLAHAEFQNLLTAFNNTGWKVDYIRGVSPSRATWTY